MRTFFQDLRYGSRALRDNPGFALVAILTLAFGIAVNTAVFSWIDTVFVRPIPGVSNNGQLVALETVAVNSGPVVSYRDYRDFRDNLKLLSGLVVSMPLAFNLGEPGREQRTWGELVSGNYFAVLGARPFLGRYFLPEEYGDKPGAYPVAVVSHHFWRTQMHADPGQLGRSIRVNGELLTVVGVAPPEFLGARRGLAFDLWAPITMATQLRVDDGRIFEHRGFRNLNALGRVKPGVSIEQARAEVDALARQLAGIHVGTNEGRGATLATEAEARSGMQANLRVPLRVLLAMSIVVFLIVCANTANLLLARATVRQREFGIRLALGASRWRIARQVLTESFLLASLGAIVGLPLAMWLVQGLLLLAPRGGPQIRLDVELNLDVLVFTALACAAAALVFGAAPAVYAARRDAASDLRDSGRGRTSGARSLHWRNLLVVSEVALALVALVGAGLFVNSLHTLRTIHPGFDSSRVLVARFFPPPSVRTFEEWKQFSLRLRERLEGAPGITGVSFSDVIPLGPNDAGPGHHIEVDGYVPARGEDMTIYRSLVAPGYFDVLRIPMVEGRDFTELDDSNTAPVMIVNQTFARHFFGDANPIGRKIHNWGKIFTVVGVVKDSKYYRLTEAPVPYFFAPFRQLYAAGHSPGDLTLAFYVRTAGDVSGALGTLRRVAVAIDPHASPFFAMPLEEYNDRSLFLEKLAARLLGTLGVVSMLLAALGLYGVMAYAVNQRTQELGIRLALGAQPRALLAMVMRAGLVLTAAGVVVGSAAALVATRFLASLIHGGADPIVFAAAALFLGVVAMLASYLPARRATKVDPMTALRCQ